MIIAEGIGTVFTVPLAIFLFTSGLRFLSSLEIASVNSFLVLLEKYAYF